MRIKLVRWIKESEVLKEAHERYLQDMSGYSEPGQDIREKVADILSLVIPDVNLSDDSTMWLSLHRQLDIDNVHETWEEQYEVEEIDFDEMLEKGD